MFQIGLLVLLALGVGFGFDHYESIVKQNATAAQTIQTCANNVEDLKGAIVDVNKAHEERMAQERARAKAAEAEAAKAKAEADKHRATALALLDKALPPGADACVAARDLMRDYAKGRAK